MITAARLSKACTEQLNRRVFHIVCYQQLRAAVCGHRCFRIQSQAYDDRRLDIKLVPEFYGRQASD